MAAARRCANCGALPPIEATACPVCGAPLPPPEARLAEELEATANEVLAEELEELKEEAKAEVAAADQAVGRLAAVEHAVEVTEERLEEVEAAPPAGEEPREADLSEFVKRVEASVAARARAPARPPVPSRAGAAMIAVGALASVTGLFLLPTTIPGGAFTVLAGVAVLSLGAALRFGPRR